MAFDEILEPERKESVPEAEPREVYQFQCSESEYREINRLQKRLAYRGPLILAVFFVYLFIHVVFVSSTPDSILGFFFGAAFFGTVIQIKGIRAYHKIWKKNREVLCTSTYEYRIFDDYLILKVYRANEQVRESKYYYTDFEGAQQLGNWLFFKFNMQSFIVRKSDLQENSAFFTRMYRYLAKPVEPVAPNKWRIPSVVLFVASILSLFGAIALVVIVSGGKNPSMENMWMFFLLTPIPIASVVFGFVLKSKGYKYKKNVVAGIIMTVVLCIYGSFAFVFANAGNPYGNAATAQITQSRNVALNVHNQP